MKLLTAVSFDQRPTIRLQPPDDELETTDNKAAGLTSRTIVTSTDTDGPHQHLKMLGVQTGT